MKFLTLLFGFLALFVSSTVILPVPPHITTTLSESYIEQTPKLYDGLKEILLAQLPENHYETLKLFTDLVVTSQHKKTVELANMRPDLR